MKQTRISYKDRAQAMYEALVAIRSMGYNSHAHSCTDTVLAILRTAEQAILEAEKPGCAK